jgi:putative hydrolase of the HAD superfamily
MFDVIAFDADDTLWHNETLYARAQAQLKQLLSQYCSPECIDQQLYQTEMRNLEHYGYGIKAFALSMIETAIELTEGQIDGRGIRQIIELAKEMLQAKVELLEYAESTLAELSARYDLMVITKGDLRDQQSKLARSGLDRYFKHVEIVSDKTRASYQAILDKYKLEAARFLMIGNSLRSDILPILELGGKAIYIPYHLTWVHETVDQPSGGQREYFELEHLGLVPALVEKLEAAETNIAAI